VGRSRAYRAARRGVWWPHPRFASLGMLAWAVAGWLGSTPVAAAEPEFDLIGSWYVLIHYKDSASDDPEAERWKDGVWNFEEKAGRVQWAIHPIVVFEDQSGRFERLGSAGSRRVLQYWEPNPAQLAQIEDGLEVNVRGSMSKGLRGSVQRGYRSGGGLRAQSASVIGYSESWEIDGLPRAPVFTRAVVMGSARTESMEGRTRLTTLEVLDGGRRLEGVYDRDGTSHGSFVMNRVARFRTAGGKGTRNKGKRERQRSFLDDFSGEFFGSEDEREALEARIREQGDSEALRRELRRLIVDTLKRAMRERDRGSAALRNSELEALAGRLVAMVFDEGQSMSQIEQMWRQGELRP